jgi:ComF family protein
MGMIRLLRAPIGPVLEVVFPSTCWASGVMADEVGGFSEAVRMQLAALAAQRYCRHCGLTTGPHTLNDFHNPCGRCGSRDAGVRRTARVGTFSEPLVTLVHRLKFGRSWELAAVLAPYLHRAIAQVAEEGGVTVDALLPVPLHWFRKSRRGFNQAEELARQAAKLGGWQVMCPLRRVRRTAEQARIDAPTKRRENLRGAFICRADRRLAGKHVWIIDDVSTTGATIHAAATAIRKLPRELRPASINAGLICVTDHGSPGVVASASSR